LKAIVNDTDPKAFAVIAQGHQTKGGRLWKSVRTADSEWRMYLLNIERPTFIFQNNLTLMGIAPSGRLPVAVEPAKGAISGPERNLY
jgi:hypothetical protein